MLINKLNKYGENNNIEVKKEVPAEHKKYLKSVVAFANGFGGKIIFGIEEKKDSFEICGLSGDVFKIKDSITNSIFSSIEPHIIPSIDLDTIEDKTILIVNVPSGWDRPYYLKSEGEFDDDLWNAFNEARQKFYAKRNEFYEKLQYEHWADSGSCGLYKAQQLFCCI